MQFSPQSHGFDCMLCLANSTTEKIASMDQQFTDPNISNTDPLIEWVFDRSLNSVDAEFLSDLHQLLERQFWKPATAHGESRFYNNICDTFPLQVPEIAKRKMEKIAIASLFGTTEDDQCIALAILRMIATPACANACVLALQIVDPSELILIHQIVSAINRIREHRPDPFVAIKSEDLQAEANRLGLSWRDGTDQFVLPEWQKPS